MKNFFIFIFVVGVCFICYQLVRTSYYIHLGKKISHVAIAHAYEQHPDSPTKRILNIGDSSVVGVGAKDPNNSVAGRIGQKYPLAEVVNKGVNGLKTKELIPQLLKLQEEKFDIILIHIGGNDIVRLTDVEEAEKDLQTVVGLAKNMADHVIILHSGNVGSAKLFPLGTRWFFTKRTILFRAAWMRVAKANHAQYVDLFVEKAEDPFVQNPKLYYAPDMFHPSDDGYGVWFNEIEKTLNLLTNK